MATTGVSRILWRGRSAQDAAWRESFMGSWGLLHTRSLAADRHTGLRMVAGQRREASLP
jgi:hypothetical protein